MEPTHALALLYVAVGATVLLLAARRALAPRTPPPRAPIRYLADEDVADHLRDLHDHYVEQVNMAVAEGREDLVRQLSDDYADEALLVMASSGG